MPDIKPVTLEGEIAEIDHDARYFTISTRSGILSAKIFWPAQYETYMKKQRAGFYEKFTAMPTQDNAFNVIDIRYESRPADFPKSQRTGYKAPARNDALIVLQCCYKECSETTRDWAFIENECAEITPEERRNMIRNTQEHAVQQAIADAKALLQAAEIMQG